MRSITLHTARRICIQQSVESAINNTNLCKDCVICNVCMYLFDTPPKDWDESIINNDSQNYYDMIKGSTLPNKAFK